MRPKQWIKNLIIFVPLLFSKEFMNVPSVFNVLIVFVIFSLFVGSTYIINDYKDINKDKNHPTKKNRPLVAGKLNKQFAIIFSIFLLIMSLILAYYLGGFLLLLLFLCYLANTLLYSFFLKKIEILDVFSIAIGFLIRGLIGTAIIDVSASSWLLIMLFFGALWFGFLKRYQEVKLGSNTRSNITKYNEHFLEQIISMITGIIIITYALYTFNSVQSMFMIITIPFVAFGIIRFYYNIFFLKKYEECQEDILLRDKFILIDILIFIILVIFVLIYQ